MVFLMMIRKNGLLALPLFLAISAAQAAEHSFVDCQGKFTITESTAAKSTISKGSIKILPYPKDGGLRGVSDWKAVISTPTGDYEVKPLASFYSPERQAITYAYSGSEGSLELGIGLSKKERIRGNERGDFDFGLIGLNAKQVSGLNLECVFSKYLIN